MDISAISKQLIKFFIEKYTSDGTTEFSVSSLLGSLQNTDTPSLLSALTSLQDKGLLSLLGNDENSTVKLIPEAMQKISEGGLLHKGMELLGGLLKK